MNIDWKLVGTAALTAALGGVGGLTFPTSDTSHILPRHAVVAIQAYLYAHGIKPAITNK